MIKPILTCPLGSKCEEIRDGAIYRCAWYTEMHGQNPNTGEETHDTLCAIALLPILQVEVSRTNRGQTQALESIRNLASDRKRLIDLNG